MEEVPGQNGMRKILFECFEVEKYEHDELILVLKPSSLDCDSVDFYDDGLILALADEMASICTPLLLKKYGMHFGFSLNLKMVSFGKMIKSKKYKMIIAIKEHQEKQLLYEIKVIDEAETLVKLISHLKRITNHKF